MCILVDRKACLRRQPIKIKHNSITQIKLARMHASVSNQIVSQSVLNNICSIQGFKNTFVHSEVRISHW